MSYCSWERSGHDVDRNRRCVRHHTRGAACHGQYSCQQEVELVLTDAAKDRLAEEGYQPEFGARPLKRAIQKSVQNPLAEAILDGTVSRGQTAIVDWFEESGFVVRPGESAPSEEPQPA